MVGTDLVEVERLLVERRLGCPVCPGVLAPWSHGRARPIRGPRGLVIGSGLMLMAAGVHRAG